MTMTRGSLANLLAPGFRKIVFESYKEKPEEGSKLVNMNTSKRAYEEDFPVSGFGTLISKPEGTSITMQDVVQGAIKRYVWTVYGLGFRLTEEMKDDDLYAITGARMSKALGRSVRNNFEVVAHAPYNNAFNTAVVGFVSGESLCSTSHALLRGGTASNRPAVDADLSLPTLQAGIENFHALVDESGLPMMLTPKRLVVSAGFWWTAQQLLKSQYLPGGSQNDINEVANQGIMPHLSHFITDADAWFLLADQHDVNYFDRKRPTFSAADDWDTGDAKFKVTRRNGSGFGGWRGIYGSQGA